MATADLDAKLISGVGDIKYISGFTLLFCYLVSTLLFGYILKTKNTQNHNGKAFTLDLIARQIILLVAKHIKNSKSPNNIGVSQYQNYKPKIYQFHAIFSLNSIAYPLCQSIIRVLKMMLK